MRYIFISDVHIGTNTPENWYQSSAHESYLKAILQYIQTNSNEIQDVVILGDWLELWMYTPEPQISASLNEIINSNPGIFTKQADGDFITCMDSIQGNLCYVHGNHDMTIDFDELNNYIKLQSDTNKQIVCLDRIYGNNGIYAEHGHYYDLLCQPDNNDSNIYKPLPIGYFISRVAALWCEQKLQKDNKQNSAELLNQGYPDKESIIKTIISTIKDDYGSFAHILMINLANLVGYNNPKDLIFTIPDGTSISAAEIENLFPSVIKSIDDVVELLLVNINNSLDDYGKALCNESYNKIKNKVVVMGHTHSPVLKEHSFLGFDKAIYVNSGFLCPSIPDMGNGKIMTFVEVEENQSGFIVRLKKVDYPDTTITTLIESSC